MHAHKINFEFRLSFKRFQFEAESFVIVMRSITIHRHLSKHDLTRKYLSKFLVVFTFILTLQTAIFLLKVLNALVDLRATATREK